MFETLQKNMVEGGGVSPVSWLDRLQFLCLRCLKVWVFGREPLWYKGLRGSTCNNRHNAK